MSAKTKRYNRPRPDRGTIALFGTILDDDHQAKALGVIKLTAQLRAGTEGAGLNPPRVAVLAGLDAVAMVGNADLDERAALLGFLEQHPVDGRLLVVHVEVDRRKLPTAVA